MTPILRLGFATRRFQQMFNLPTALCDTLDARLSGKRHVCLAQSGNTATWTIVGRFVANAWKRPRRLNRIIWNAPARTGVPISSKGPRCPKVVWFTRLTDINPYQTAEALAARAVARCPGQGVGPRRRAVGEPDRELAAMNDRAWWKRNAR